MYGKKIPGPEWVRWTVMAGWPTVAFLGWWAVGRRDGRQAFIGLCSLIVVVNALAYMHRSAYLDSYSEDSAFVQRVKEKSVNRPLFVVADSHPLNASWLLFYLDGRPKLLHNVTFLRDDRIVAPEVLLVCRASEASTLQQYGQIVKLDQSVKTRGESGPQDRWAFYSLRFDPKLERYPGNIRISPMQATGRASGPFLGKEAAYSMMSR